MCNTSHKVRYGIFHLWHHVDAQKVSDLGAFQILEDRKSTRLNSSHLVISYAVFCLKKKTRFSESAVRSMGRDTSGVRGMNVSQKGNSVLAMDVARDDDQLLVVTENRYGKRTDISEY